MSQRTLGMLDSRGERVLPWAAGNVAALSPSPSLRAVALLVQGPSEPVIFRSENDEPEPISSLDGFRVMRNHGFGVCGLSWSPDGRSIACLEWSGIGVLTLLDAATGERTMLTTLPNVSGTEVPLFSPDGRWILVSTRYPQLVSIDHRRVVDLPFEWAYVDWWPTKGSSTLFVLSGPAGSQRFGAYDLGSGELEDLGAVVLPTQADLPAHRQLVHSPRMSPDGTEALVGTSFGPHGKYQEENGSRDRVGIIDTSTGRITLPISAFADDAQWLERQHRSWEWAGPSTSAGVPAVSPALVAGGRPFDAVEPRPDFDPTDRDETVVVWSW